MTIELGYMVRDKLTGFTGVAENRATFLYGCDRYCVQPPVDKDGKIPESTMIDEPQLELVADTERVVEPMQPPEQSVKLGLVVFDPIRGVEGTAFGRAVYLNGCARLFVHPKRTGKDNDKSFWVDEPQVEVRTSLLGKDKKTIDSVPRARTGGPAPSSSKY